MPDEVKDDQANIDDGAEVEVQQNEMTRSGGGVQIMKQTGPDKAELDKMYTLADRYPAGEGEIDGEAILFDTLKQKGGFDMMRSAIHARAPGDLRRAIGGQGAVALRRNKLLSQGGH